MTPTTERDLWWRLGWIEREYATMLSQHGNLPAGSAQQMLDELARRARSSDSVLRRVLRDATAAGPCPSHVVTRADANYPTSLLQSAKPPFCLYGRGNLALLDPLLSRVAIVGSRRARGGARRRTREIAADLAGCGVCVVSGLALGIDAEAHRGALDAGGTTIAVLPAGLDHVVPRQHHRLAQQILDADGLLLSPYPDCREPAKWQFANRNTVVAALADFLLVSQAAARSGTQHTVDSALDLGIEVGIVPGGWDDPAYQASCRYLLDGAQPVTTANHILDRFGLVAAARRAPVHPLVAALDLPRSLAELAQASGAAPTEVAAALARLEVDGVVIRTPDGRYQRGARRADQESAEVRQPDAGDNLGHCVGA